MALVAEGVRYNPKAGFIGIDHLIYRLNGALGGTNETTVTVAVTPDAGKFASVVNLVRRSSESADVCLFGDPGSDYLLETSHDLTAWQEVRTLTTASDGGMIFQLVVDPVIDHMFFRARRKP